jgi:hypothetical protein
MLRLRVIVCNHGSEVSARGRNMLGTWSGLQAGDGGVVERVGLRLWVVCATSSGKLSSFAASRGEIKAGNEG